MHFPLSSGFISSSLTRLVVIGHSMHGGGATPLVGAGVSPSRIQAIGRTLDSTLFFQAVRLPWPLCAARLI